MDAFVTLLKQSLIQQPRQNHYHLRRGAIAAVCGLLVLWYFHRHAHTAEGMGLAVFELIGTLAIGLACLTAPLVTAGSIARERANNTLGLLLMSDITPLRLVIGRLGTGSWQSLLTLGSLLPLFLLCISLGGVSGVQVAMLLAVLATILITGAALGLACSSLVATEKQAAFWSLLIATGMFLAVPTLIVKFAEFMTGTLSAFSLVASGVIEPTLSPFKVLKGLTDGSASALPFIALMSLLTIAMIAVTRWRVKLISSGELDTRQAAQADSRLHRWQRQSQRPTRENENPIVWKERPIGMWTFCAGSVGLLTAIVLPFSLSMGNTSTLLPLLFYTVGGIVFSLGVLVRSSLAFTLELENRTLDLLILSGMNADDIIMGKFWGYVNAFMPWLCTMGLGLLLLSNNERFNMIAIAGMLAISATFAFSSWAMLLSICGRKTMAMLMGLGGFGLGSITIPSLLQSPVIAGAAVAFNLGFGIFLVNRIYRRFAEINHVE